MLTIATVYNITTVDNEYSPFDEFKSWYSFDTEIKKYDTCQKLARIEDYLRTIAIEQKQMTKKEAELFDFREAAIDELIRIDPLKIYKKISIEIPDGEKGPGEGANEK